MQAGRQEISAVAEAGGCEHRMLALACFSLATWRPACFETGRCCPVRLCGLVACYERCVHKGQRGNSYAERGGTNDRSSHTAVVSHTRQQRGCGWIDAILTTPPPARGCEERCRDRVQAQPPPWRQRPPETPHEDPAGFRTRPTTTTDTPWMQRCSLMRLGMHLRDGSASDSLHGR